MLKILFEKNRPKNHTKNPNPKQQQPYTHTQRNNKKPDLFLIIYINSNKKAFIHIISMLIILLKFGFTLQTFIHLIRMFAHGAMGHQIDPS